MRKYLQTIYEIELIKNKLVALKKCKLNVGNVGFRLV